MASGGQRAFANKINKRGAAEVRKQVSSAYLGDLSKSSSGINISASAAAAALQNVPLCDTVEPPDFEDFLVLYQHAIDRDPLRHLLEFPVDDIQVEVVRRKVRTISPVIPERGFESDRHIQDCVRCYTKDYLVINRRYRNCIDQHNLKDDRHKRLQSLSRQEYELNSRDSTASQDSFERKSTASDVQLSSWANSVLDLKNSQADPLIPNILESMPQDNVDAINERQRQHSREDAIFSLYPPQPEEEQIEQRQMALPPAEHFGHRLLVKCLQLKLDLEIEPVFASAALYNIAERKKISENFYFDLNSDGLRKMIEGHVPYPDMSSVSRSCIFDITHPSPDIFLVVKLEKVLQQGDLSEVAEPYMKDDKNRDRARSNAAYFCERLGKYRMPFAWTAVCIMNIVGSTNPVDLEKETIRSDSLERRPGSVLSSYEGIRKASLDRPKSGTPEKWDGCHTDELGLMFDTFRPVTLTVSSFYKQESDKLADDDLFKFLFELKKPTYVLKKLKSLSGVLKLEILPCPVENKYCLTPELYKIDPFPDEKTRPTKEVLEFSTKDIYEPYTTYRNLLFLYPKSLNFANRQGSARNIAVKVNFMQDEDEQHALPIIFGKSNCPEFFKDAYTSVTYHNKSPSFYDEIKIRLPAKLNESHHLLFTIYHISCQRKVEMTPIETVIGYTWLPLLSGGHLLSGEFCLPVSIEKPPSHYSMLHPDVQLPSMKWVDNHKGLFTVVLDSVSSIHTLDEHLDRFLNLVHAAEESRIPPRIGDGNFEVELSRAIASLMSAKSGPLVRFMPLILDKLLQLLVRPPVVGGQIANVVQTSFEAIAQIVKHLQNIRELKCDKHGRNSLLTSYIEYLCTLPHPDPSQYSPPPNMALGPGSYATLGRPISLPVSKQQRLLSSSDPDLPSSNPGSPDNEVASLMGSRNPEHQISPNRHDASNRYPRLYGRKLVHEELVLQWVVASGSTRDLVLSNSWFFFELMVKSMEQHLAKNDFLAVPRKMRFPAQFTDDINTLISLLTRDIVERYSSIQEFPMIRGLNSSLAFFINSCLSLMDRGFVFQLIKTYCKAISGRISSHSMADVSTLLLLKLDFIRIVCSHEHYTTLNLPFSLPITPSGPPSPTSSIASSTSQTSFTSTGTLVDRGLYTELTNDYRHQHFLTGLVLSDLATVLETHLPVLHNKAISVVCNLLASHDADPRFQTSDAKARIASLYLPLVGIVADVLPQLYDPHLEAKSRANEQQPNDGVVIDRTVAMAISGSSIYSMSGDSSVSKKLSLSQEATQDLLLCFLWVLKNVDQRVLRNWWSDLSVGRLNQFLEVIYFCVSNFEYKGKKPLRQYSMQTAKKSSDMKSKMEEYMLGSMSARSEMMMRHKQTDPSLSSPSSEVALRLRWRKDQTQWRQPNEQLDIRNRDASESVVDSLLAAEISMVALDTLELIVQIVQMSDSLQNLLSFILRVLLHCLSLNQSSLVLQNMFATERSLVSKFPELIFEEDTEQCADLCLRLLRHCSSPVTNIRTHASASLYMLMRQNFEIGNNFARVKMQVTMSLSSLVGQYQTFNEEYLRKSLKTILVYAEVDTELRDTTFPEQVRDLVFNLHMILSDTIKMKEFQEDPEMLLDLMYRIAKGYQNSPDLRLTWLHNMAAKHNERQNFAEAAQCLVHAAGLVAEYLNMLEDKPHLPIGCVSLQHISRNVLEESAVSEDVVSPDEEGICTGKYFSETGLVGLLEQAASSFTMAGMFEAVNNVYKVLIPVYEYNRDLKKLSSIHGKLQGAFQSIIKQEGKRVFGTYFRIGFYGAKFGDLDGHEFIYKEPAITKLPEISHRLESFYTDKFGQGVVEIIKDSNTVEKEHLNPDKAFIQMTYVEPHFDLYEQRDRVTFFEKNYNIKRFMYATPFTTDGRAHGDLSEQYKRKTVLTTSHAFPYVKTRLSVIGREQLILSPIEVAIEDIQKKTKELGLALCQEPPDPKMLQMVLQGCIGTTVNQGPVEIALVFLQPLIDGELPSKHHNKLRSCFKDFLKKCGDALHKNKSLIGLDQKEYQKELERNYQHIKLQLTPLISSTIHTSTIKRKHKRDRKQQVIDYSEA